MRIIRFIAQDGNTYYGNVLENGTAQVLADHPLKSLQLTSQKLEIKELMAPIDPPAIFCIGKNYAEHAREFGSEIPAQPIIFIKPITTLNHPNSPVKIPKCLQHGPETDYEAELAIIIGKKGVNISEENAYSHILGYTCANDITARRMQKHAGGGQWARGKGFDGFLPLGPAIVTPDEIKDPHNLSISLTLNGKIMQDGNTADMIFSIPKLISYLSQDTTLLPGTVILTGTPSGVGFARDPQVWLSHGDSMTVEIKGVGKLTNHVVK